MKKLLILFGLFFVYTWVVSWVGFVWTNYVVKGATYSDPLGEILVRALNLLVPLIASVGVGAAARGYLTSPRLFRWLVALGSYVAVTHYLGYRGIFRQPVFSYWGPAAIEGFVLALAVFAGAASASRRIASRTA